MTELDDLTLRRAAKGDNRAFRALYDFYAPYVWKIAYRTLNGDKRLATEAVQDVFVRVHGSLKRFGFKSALSTWLYRITYNACIAKLASRRSNGRESELKEDTATLPPQEKSAEQQAVHRILASLNAEDRFLLVSREVTGMGFDELARITGKKSGALRTRVSRIKDMLRKEFSDEWREQDVA